MSLTPRRFLAVTIVLLTLVAAALAAVLGAGVVRAQEENTGEVLCRFGVNVLGDPTPFDLESLRMGWYVNYGAWENAPRPGGAHYAPIISLSQVGDDGYDYSPKGAQLEAAVAGNPGALWFIGNEPDRPELQDDLLPHLYADAYHELYYLIKGLDPTAEIVAGTIVQPTPVRLLYLDMMLDSYKEKYGEHLPADGWSIHNFILNEENCAIDPDPPGCWGADVPPGIDWVYGEQVEVDDNDDIERFKERIWRFRHWMRERGYRDLPLYVSEYGILMPQDYGFDNARVNAFMNATFDFMGWASDPELGDPDDEYRLVQRWSWYSSDDRATHNGWLFDPDTHQISAMGQNYANYTAPMRSAHDFYPVRLLTDPEAPSSNGAPVNVNLVATIANGGSLSNPSPEVAVRFYNGDPAQGGVQIGAQQTVSLSGCGTNTPVSVTWNNVPPGAHDVYVVVDPGNNVDESNEQNNSMKQTIVVATDHITIPAIFR